MANKYHDIMAALGTSPNSNNPGRIAFSDEQLDELEKQVGYGLPDDYREFLRDYGGCSIENFALFSVQEGDYVRKHSVWIFFGSDPVMSDIALGYRASVESYDISSDVVEGYPGLRFVRSMEGVEEIGWPAELLPIGIDMGGNSTCLALFGLHAGAVFHWKNCPSGEGVCFVASSFDEFMRSLRKNEDV